MQKSISADEAVKVIRSGNRVYVHGIAAAPQALIQSMTARADELRDVEVVHLHTEGAAPYAEPGMELSFRVNALFVGSNVRKAIQEGRGDYIPIFLSEVPNLFRSGLMPIDVALMQVSPPDRHGFCSLGTSVDASLAAMQSAKHVIAQINPRMPRTFGDGLVHVDDLHAIVECEEPLNEVQSPPPTEIEAKIGRHCSELVEDGATLQMGIGAIPNAVLAALKHHKNLGVHTEMFSDGLISLVKSGVVNDREKKVRTGKIVASFIWGTRELYDFVDENPQVSMLDVAYVNDTSVIRRNPKVTAINSAIEVDITGQVCADSIGTVQYSGVGGQMDFIRGAALSEGGKPIIALPSMTKKNLSRIVSELKSGAGVVTTRAHVHYVVTEYGIANLYGKNLRQRAKAMIEIAHPDFREELHREACERFGPLVC
ncbi:MAG TPA: acetyl-CoA hydrolase/transferase C-terminal domain-containing protein [Fimbriimonadaceae bacterium]|nr:acetyl-CoA hydrolase/transferase C-terminal domain-containing protein [Fimbriimonadaceae bacterium]